MLKNNRELTVNLDDRSYSIRIGRSFCEELSNFLTKSLKGGQKGVILIDENFLSSQPEFSQKISQHLPYLVVPSGESSKSVEQLAKAWDFLASCKIDRSGFLLAVGGGVVGDLGGFVAASYLRGIPFYQVPTTLLAMVDSSVGGKTGINIRAGKNLIGSFHQPNCVWADLDLLKTLPSREFSAGMAEVIKYGMLGDEELYQQLLNRADPYSTDCGDLADLVYRCCLNKARIVQADERETVGLKGGRALLNLGHTFAHAIEKVSGYGNYLHGEAVAIGLLCAFRLSQELGNLKELRDDELIKLLNSYNLPVSLNKPISSRELVSAMYSDKKVDRGMLRFVVMKNIGEAYCTDDVDEDMVENVWSKVGAV